MLFSPQEQRLCQTLRDLPRTFNNRYTDLASRTLLEILFYSLAGHRDDYLRLFFPHGPPGAQGAPNSTSERWSLRTAQGAVEGAEYTEAARGHPCGHIFKSGEATYRCKTCTVDDTCVLCARCFDASDHEGHLVYVSISPGNSGCCDCGDAEAWVRPVHCNIHTALSDPGSKATGKAKEGSLLPQDLLDSIRMTTARALDYLCDVFSCSPEQLRLPKTEASIKEDERLSRLSSKWYEGSDQQETDQEFALILWNDEKHTVNDVKEVVSRACRKRTSFGLEKAHEVDDVGRSVIVYSKHLDELLQMAKTIEHIKLTVTIRSARDTFREQMCATIIEWISDIAGCSVGDDHHVLRNVICEEMLKSWRMGSEAHHKQIGMDGLDDHEMEDNMEEEVRLYGRPLHAHTARAILVAAAGRQNADDENDGNSEEEEEAETLDEMDLDILAEVDRMSSPDLDLDMDNPVEPDDVLEAQEATLAGYPPPPPPPPAPRRHWHGQTLADPDEGDLNSSQVAQNEAFMEVPKTPKVSHRMHRPPRSPKYWLEKPEGYNRRGGIPVHEDLWQRVRLDYMILYDLRMWKKVRIDMRDLFITTVVTLPHFKRLLGLRFAGLYTALAQLYLIADREPDHSIINLSLQMLTTPSITAEVVERGNFLTNLMAILYTFLTTRQVGYPSDINPWATLAFEAGAVTNRRMYHFFMDMKYLLSSEHVHERLRQEERYLLQFLDLVKLHQGICPNVRAVGEHLEYETDAWISASIITREMNKLCRQFSEAFVWSRDQDPSDLCRAIRHTTKTVIINSIGAERHRFSQSEIKSWIKFKIVEPYKFELLADLSSPPHEVVDFVVEKEPMSFHHALHYTLSWLIDRGKSMSKDQLQALLLFNTQDLKQPPVPSRTTLLETSPNKYLLALFDFPLRVCAWLAQMRAGMWVRNGITLRHQMSTYRSVTQRDVAYQRDIFLLQVALVVCPPATFLASMIDRFGMTDWVRGNYEIRPGHEDHQILDVAEDFVHLLIILLSDRIPLLPVEDEPETHHLAMRRDIAHVLCFKPLSYSELTSRLADKVEESDDFGNLLSEMTTFRPPEGLSDTGRFELKEQYIEEVDPYIAQYSRNQREEVETIHKNYIAKKTGKPAADIVYEPKLRQIQSGIFKDLPAFTRLPLFAQIIYNFLGYALAASTATPKIPTTKVEAFTQFVLQLVLLAMNEDMSAEGSEMDLPRPRSFVDSILRLHDDTRSTGQSSIFTRLNAIAGTEDFKACEPKIRVIIYRLQQKRPKWFITRMAGMGSLVDRMDTASPATASAQEKEMKKKLALERQAKVMAQFKEQQNSFIENQAMDWGDDDFSDLDEEFATPTAEQEEKIWKYPTGTCIFCQEVTDDQKLYGTFSLLTESTILRQTDIQDSDWVAEVANTPSSLDRSAEAIRPFGVSGQNRRLVEKITSDGRVTVTERQDLGKGFPYSHTKRGPVATGCGHIMHFSCFEVYLQATQRRHIQQIVRNHPERIDAKEFLCPLCKALGNTFLPIIWKGKTLSYPGILQPSIPFEDWLLSEVPLKASGVAHTAERATRGDPPLSITRYHNMFVEYGQQELIPRLGSTLPDLSRTTNRRPLPPPTHHFIPSFMTLPPPEDPRDPFVPPDDNSYSVSLPPLPMLELVKVYQRMRDTMRINGLHTRFNYPSPPSAPMEDFTHTDALAKSLAFSISAVEIAQRGVESDPGSTLLDKISSQSLTHLRILSETVSTYIAVGGMYNKGMNKTNQEFTESETRQLRQLLTGHPQVYNQDAMASELKSLPPLLQQDAFVFLTECSTCLVPALGLDIHHILRLCYLSEVVRVVMAFLHNPEAAQQCQSRLETHNGHYDSVRKLKDYESFGLFLSRISNECRAAAWAVQNEVGRSIVDILPRFELESSFTAFLFSLAASYALAFVRKAAILVHVRFGIEFPSTDLSTDFSTDFSTAHEPELDRLSKVLNLPSLEETFLSLGDNAPPAQMTWSLMRGWIRHWTWYRENKRSTSRPSISLSHPAIFELVGLPKNYDTLTDEAIRRKCPTTGKELTDPCVCLFCGEIFCSQAVCCMTSSNKGGCYQHQAKCGGNVGLYINIRKCMVLFMNGGHGSWAVAPYLDKHGETDPTLRRHHQLYLNQRRYDVLLRNVWLQHGIPSTIARRLEGDMNNGGWETL